MASRKTILTATLSTAVGLQLIIALSGLFTSPVGKSNFVSSWFYSGIDLSGNYTGIDLYSFRTFGKDGDIVGTVGHYLGTIKDTLLRSDSTGAHVCSFDDTDDHIFILFVAFMFYTLFTIAALFSIVVLIDAESVKKGITTASALGFVATLLIFFFYTLRCFTILRLGCAFYLFCASGIANIAALAIMFHETKTYFRRAPQPPETGFRRTAL